MLKKPPKQLPAPQGYRDIFGQRDARKGPLVLSDRTSVEWPKGWTKEDAARYRKAIGLLPERAR